MKAAKKTYKRSGGGVASNAGEFTGGAGEQQEGVDNKGNQKAAHENSGDEYIQGFPLDIHTLFTEENIDVAEENPKRTIPINLFMI